MKKCETLDEFKNRLRKAIDSQNMEEFVNLARYCPFPPKTCRDCFLSDEDGPREFIKSTGTCLLGSIINTYWDHYADNNASRKNVLALLVLEGIKLLAYLENEK